MDNGIPKYSNIFLYSSKFLLLSNKITKSLYSIGLIIPVSLSNT